MNNNSVPFNIFKNLLKSIVLIQDVNTKLDKKNLTDKLFKDINDLKISEEILVETLLEVQNIPFEQIDYYKVQLYNCIKDLTKHSTITDYKEAYNKYKKTFYAECTSISNILPAMFDK